MENEQEMIELARNAKDKIHNELSKVIVGQKDVIDQILLCLFTGSHCLLTGVPGLAKTLLVSSIAQIFDLKFNRIQFTPDLMPADVTGLEILEESQDGHRHMKFVKGPIFANVVLADEINRTPPKTQSSLLEAMQEHQVTAAGVTYKLEQPFFVLATQNPIEMEGTYPLPEAQLDRFMFNVMVDFPTLDEEVEVIIRTTSQKPEELSKLFTAEEVIAFKELVMQVPIAKEVVQYAVELASMSRPSDDSPEFIKTFVNYGAG
ncbi:MAG: AAA family ATPase, partial [Lentisphaeraceae bacterium]|nr:AAA family ATPase [Lentisphaeraceae bacterium]